MSTGGAAIKAIIKQVVAASRHGTIRTPNHPTYRRLFVDVTHSQKRSHEDFCCVIVAVATIINFSVEPSHPPHCDYFFFLILTQLFTRVLVPEPFDTLVPDFL
jgi:hypothetical protein